jgi:hypothetical protein
MEFRVEVDRAIIKNLAPGNYFPLLCLGPGSRVGHPSKDADRLHL